jgi:YjjG family noncanonical pyrimidine nucleotidase
MIKAYKHLFFDLDHTLWDFEANAHECLIEMYDSFDMKSLGAEDIGVFCEKFSEANHYYWALLEAKQTTVDVVKKKRFQAAFEKLNIYIEEDLSLEMTEVFIKLLPSKTKLIAGTIDILNYLKPRYQMHILSNGFEKIQIQKMQSSGIDHYFDKLITNEKAKALKPDKVIFNYALTYANASLSNSLMIGDNYIADIKGAMNAQFDTVFYNPAKQEIQEKPTFEIFNLIEIKDFL